MRVDITSTRKKYRVIYADPPWKFSSKEATGKIGGGGKTTNYKPLERIYPTIGGYHNMNENINTRPAQEPEINEVDGEPIFHADEEEGDDDE